MNLQQTNRVLEAYQHLLQAEKNKKSVAPLTDLYSDITIHHAYRIQMNSINQKVKDGQKVVGKKIGLTSFAMQKLLGVDQPDYGHLMDSMEVPNGGTIPMETQPEAARGTVLLVQLLLQFFKKPLVRKKCFNVCLLIIILC